MIKAIVFDLDDTLYCQQAPFDEAIKILFPQLLNENLDELFILFRSLSEQLYEQTEKITEETIRKMNHVRLSKSLKAKYDFQVTESMTENFEAEYERQLRQIRLSLPLVCALQELAKSYKLGIITNGYTQRQEVKLEALKIRKIIPEENILISEKFGVAKPDRRIFDQMAKRLACDSSELIYIGDNYRNDVLGAKEAGWKAWWLNHKQQLIPDEKISIADKELISFIELERELINL
ncbi:haloacid dehalogenase [Enterococcus florum]|uniref:Haloacid dehalogenase n=1 Tax=Enterococcus florum TaxID=2480627 RepID=A0A4P5PBN9_9ENTE|nr:HAD family hydrolase [Enterococcus florum]GCF95460.1 haloacid dehalogenase [Enterococcus florum]